MKTGARYGALLIALYLGVAYSTGAGELIDKATAGTGTVVKAFQARP